MSNEKKYDGQVLPLEFETSKGPPYKLTKKSLKMLVDKGCLDEDVLEKGE